MSYLDVKSLTEDPEGMAFLREVIAPMPGQKQRPVRGFSLKARARQAQPPRAKLREQEAAFGL